MNQSVLTSMYRLIGMFFAQALIILILFAIVKKSVDPIKYFTGEVTKISGSTIGYQIEIDTHDEIGDLAKAFNKICGRLIKVHHTLEEKVKGRTAELKIKEKEAVAANVAKSEFLANMSQELKTPLNHIKGSSIFG
jgi:nitrate/nitrite-specific signal transduction histidine kinase